MTDCDPLFLGVVVRNRRHARGNNVRGVPPAAVAGNVWEWTGSLWGGDWNKPEYSYPYNSLDRRENLKAGDRLLRALQGGSWFNYRYNVRCSARNRNLPNERDDGSGFRVVVSPIF